MLTHISDDNLTIILVCTFLKEMTKYLGETLGCIPGVFFVSFHINEK